MGEQADLIVDGWLDSMWADEVSPELPENPRVTRALKHKAHLSFDRLWRSGRMSRGEAYKWLAHRLGLRYEDAHMSRMDQHAVLERVIEVSDREMGTPLAAADFPDDMED